MLELTQLSRPASFTMICMWGLASSLQRMTISQYITTRSVYLATPLHPTLQAMQNLLKLLNLPQRGYVDHTHHLTSLQTVFIVGRNVTYKRTQSTLIDGGQLLCADQQCQIMMKHPIMTIFWTSVMLEMMSGLQKCISMFKVQCVIHMQQRQGTTETV